MTPSKPYLPEDLSALPEFAGGEPKFAVFGKPVGHSLSPLMQNAALRLIAQKRGIWANSRYFAFEVGAETLGDVLPMFRAKNFAGINLTIPHKVEAMKLADELDESARLAGACNTLLASGRGWRGYNTDGFGLQAAIRRGLGREIAGADVVLIGAGGAARGAAFHLLAQKCGSLTIANRSRGRLEALARDIKSAGFECAAVSLGEGLKIPRGAIVVNATSVGLDAGDAPVLDFSKFPADAVFFDMPYRRGAETASVEAARAAGIKASSGLPMLVWQGAKSMSIWLENLGGEKGENLDVEEIARAMCAALGTEF